MRTEELDGHPCQVIGCRDPSRGPDHAHLAVVCVGDDGMPMCAPHAIAYLKRGGNVVTHRPSRLDEHHTACGEPIGPATHLQLGDGETCERCTHVVAQVAAALRGEPSWAQRGATRG